MTRQVASYTKIEFLVVLIVIVTAFSVVIPALKHSHEVPGRRAVCMNNQKQIMTALANYESQKGRYPGWRQIVGQKADGEAVVGSWVVELMPYIELGALHQTWTDPGNKPIQSAYIPLLNCPANGSVNTARPALTHVVNCGLGRADIADPDEHVSAANGVFFDHLYEDPEACQHLPPGYPRREDVHWSMHQVSNAAIAAADGTSNTVVVVENAQAGLWTYPFGSPGDQTPMIVDNVQQRIGVNWDCAESRRMDDDTWAACPPKRADPGESDIRPTAPNRCKPSDQFQSTEAVTFKFARPYSHHPGIFMASFADGRTQMVSEKISIRVYQHIMTPDSQAARGRRGDQTLPDCVSPAPRHAYAPKDLQ